jgi:CDP-glycerol glycerophosphotransferase (TagB/SpsB family)
MFGIDYYDAVLLSGEYQKEQIRTLESLRNLPEKELKVVGMTYMDAMKARLEKAEPLKDHPTTVLLAPSWGQSAILSRYGARIIEALLKTGYHVIVRPHPQSFTSEKEMIDALMQQFPDSEQLEWNRDNDNFEVLRRSDIMISDFSGVIFDFALVFDKPIIYADTSFDKSPYDACWLEEELWTFSTLPKIGEQLSEEKLDTLKDVIDRCLSEQKRQDARDAARAETWQFPGEAAKRTVDYLEEKLNELHAKEAEANAPKQREPRQRRKDRKEKK